MRTASRLFRYSVLGLLSLAWACTLPGAATAASQSSEPTPFAQSSLLTVHASSTDDWLTLHITHAADQTPVTSHDVSVSVAGHAVPVTSLGNGTYTVPVRELGGGAPILDIIVGHDGIREVLTGKLTLANAPAAPSSRRSQWLWWVLNFGVVCAAALLLARRKPPQKKESSD
jgi:hypothetical protein